jgi:hypothetical protein
MNGRTNKAELEQRLRVGEAQGERLLAQLVAAGMLIGASDGDFDLSEKGRGDYHRLLQRREQDLKENARRLGAERARGRAGNDAGARQFVCQRAPDAALRPAGGYCRSRFRANRL